MAAPIAAVGTCSAAAVSERLGRILSIPKVGSAASSTSSAEKTHESGRMRGCAGTAAILLRPKADLRRKTRHPGAPRPSRRFRRRARLP